MNAKAQYYNHILSATRELLDGTSLYISHNCGNGDYYDKNYIWIAPNDTGYENFMEEMKNFEWIIKIFWSIKNQEENVTLIFLGMEDGVCFLSDDKVVEKLRNEIKYFDHRERIWYTLAKEKNETVWTPLYIDVNTGMLVTTISTPVYSNNEFIGVLGFDLLLETIKNDILDIEFEDSGYPLLVDREGNIFVHPEYTAYGKKWNESFKEENIKNISGLEEISDEIINGTSGLKAISLNGVNHYAVFSPINEINGSLVFILPENIVTDDIEKAIKDIALIFFSIFIIVVIISIIFSSSLTKPLDDLQKATKDISEGNLERKVKARGKDEVSQLARDFNRMVAKLRLYDKELRESEEKYRSIFEESTDVIYISTPEGKIIDINEAGEKLFGYSKEELLRMNAGDLYEKIEDRKRFQKELEKNGFVRDYEVRLKRKDGKIIDCVISSVLIKKGNKVFYQGIIRDVTEIKEARKRVEMYNSLLRHDIGNRNQIALGCLELLKDEDMDEEKKILIDKAYEHVKNSQDLLKKLSIINKTQQIEAKKIDLASTLKKVIERYEPIAKEHKIKIKYEIEEGCVVADELLENVFSNLIENSIIHSNCKNITINVEEYDDEFKITIKDDGEGIPEEIFDRIFEWGVKGKDSKGSGLGLYLVKKILEGYRGKILVKKMEKGTTFEIYLKKC
ncbi:MAG TPA: sensor histidine kinase [Thermoplasmata archaeon]|nr:sensor histidine kinase [Thermoplasmata archaeon]